MTVLRGYDGADPTFSLSAAKSHNGILCSAYIVGSPGGMPHADAARVAAIRANGMGVLPNWERAADFFRTASLADCRNAGKEALTACRQLGIPDDGTIGVAFSFDYQVPASGFAHATAQLNACGDGMAGHYQPLGYAQSDLIEHWAANGLPGPHWLMASTWRATSTFTTAEVSSPAVGMVQSHDAAGNWLVSLVRDTDVNTITQPDRLAAWWPDGSPYGGGMALTDAEIDRIAQRVWAIDTIPINPTSKTNPTWRPDSVLVDLQHRLAAVQRALNPSALATAIAANIPGATTAQIEAAVKAAIDGATLEVPQ